MDSPEPSLPDHLDTDGFPATADGLRGVLRRHQRRQARLLGAAGALVLVAGGAAGYLVGNGHTSSPSTLASAANSPSASSASGGVAIAADQAGSRAPSTQLLVRDTTDGTRIRLYSQDISAKVDCQPAGSCTPPPAACIPKSLITAEVSDDQVAGEGGAPEWQTPATTGLHPVAVSVVGEGQPQPILVVVAHAGSDVSTVKLTTAYGTDTAAVTNGWVAVGEHLPADYTPGTSSEAGKISSLPEGTVTALGPTGNTVATFKLADVPGKQSPPCDPCPVPKPGATATPPTPAAEKAAQAAGSPGNAVVQCQVSQNGTTITSGSVSGSTGTAGGGTTGSGAGTAVVTNP